MNAPCGCCTGTEELTPMSTVNRPGLTALSYRVGTHATFLATMKARLSSADFPELAGLKTRAGTDPAIAFLDSWAVVADVLTFYQNRLANEGYLRTATERRSILELARLVGYSLRPGVASSVYLAYTLDEDRSVDPPKGIETTIPAGSRVQSIPEQGELPQSFETAELLKGRTQWNRLDPRMAQPQTAESIAKEGLYLKGLSTNLQPGDVLLIDFGIQDRLPVPVRVVDVNPDAANNRTQVTLRLWRTIEQAVGAIGSTIQVMLHSAFATSQEESAAHGFASGDLAKLMDFLIKSTPSKQLETIEKLLPALEKGQQEFQRKDFAKLEKLVRDLIAELELTRESLVLTRGLTFAPKVDSPGQNKAAFSELISSLAQQPAITLASSRRLPRTPASTFKTNADVIPRLLGTLRPSLHSTVYSALKNIVATEPSPIRVYALRLTAGVFGHDAPPRPMEFNTETGKITLTGDWPIIEDAVIDELTSLPRKVHEEETIINLDRSYEKVQPGTWIVVETPDTKLTQPGLLITTIQSLKAGVGRNEYGLNGETTRIALRTGESVAPSPTWIQLANKSKADNDFDAIRNTVVHAQSEELQLSEEPVTSPIGKCIPETAANPLEIELDGLYDGLDAGRWLIVTGERIIKIKNREGVILEGPIGVRGAELAMVAGVEHRLADGLPNERRHTFLTLASPGLAYCYKRESVVMYGNVVKATHGEKRKEVLGSGDGSKALQEFTLRQPPLTFVSAANPAGVDSTLQVRVNDVLWHEADSLAGLSPTDHKFVTRTDDESKTTVVFGTGQRGARLPSGQENVKSVYRNGIGKAGNVKAEQINLLVSRPLGVKEVINPLRASGGADRESRDQARQNVPLALMALDRLVSTQDYADFARTFAGIGKASAARLSNGHYQLVHVTIAGAEDILIEPSSDVYRNLTQALRNFGDPYLPIQLSVRELLALVISANVRVLPDYQWELVEPKIRAELLAEFGFERRELGQSAFLSELITAIQRVAGVAYVDVDLFDSISEAELSAPDLLEQKLATISAAKKPAARVAVYGAEAVASASGHRQSSQAVDGIYPAQLALLTPEVPDTLILKEAGA